MAVYVAVCEIFNVKEWGDRIERMRLLIGNRFMFYAVIWTPLVTCLLMSWSAFTTPRSLGSLTSTVLW